MNWSESERNIIGQLESELGSAELTAVLSEWVTATVHRILAVSVALACWRQQLSEQGWGEEAIDKSLPLIMDRLWHLPSPSPIGPTDVLSMLGFVHLDGEDDDESEDD